MKKATNKQQIEQAKTTAETTKLTATQKLDLMEDVVKNQARQIEILAEEIDRLSNVVTALAKRIGAVVRSGDEGQQISTKQVNALLMSDAAKELAGKVDFLVQQGVLVLNQSSEVNNESFVVGREFNSEKDEINPRVQFAVKSLEQDGQDKVMGKKVGDTISGDDGIDMEIIQIYTITEPKKEE